MRTTLWSSPGTCESGFVDTELRLAKSASGEGTAWICDLLDLGLGCDKVINMTSEGCVLTGSVLVNDCFEDEGRVTDPCVNIVRVVITGTCDDYSRLAILTFKCCRDMQNAHELTLAPEDFCPLGPILARRPAFAIGDWVLM